MNIINVGFNDIFYISQKDESVQSLPDDIIVFNHDHSTKKQAPETSSMPSIRIDALAFFLCSAGELSFSIDYTPYRLTKGALLGLSNRHILDNITPGSTYKGHALVISNKLLHAIIKERPAIKKLIKNTGARQPLLKLNEDEMHTMVSTIMRIRKNLDDANHAFQSELIKNDVSSLILESANIALKQQGTNNTPAIDTNSRKEEVIQSFLRLLFDHCKEQHEVSFYAKQLCMTPGNLSRIMTGASGKSPLRWISDALIAEAKLLLRRPGMNIQQVAEELHFGDQSSFGKFFKKHTSLTPVAYKREAS